MEYRSRIDEMRDLVDENRTDEALELADSINWRKVHNINELLSGSDAYAAAGKLQEARDLLLLAHERSPIGRSILYKLTMISIKLGELDDAQSFYNDFVQIAPHDSQKYILKYNLNIARGADTNTIIKILEQLKEQDFIEEWAFELAYLYHKCGMGEKCIELCDEIILWFGDGPYVERALELKMIYQPLGKAQEEKYRSLQHKKDGITEIVANEQLRSGELISHTVKIPSVELPPERFNTINLQAEIKKNIEEIMQATEAGKVVENMDAIKSLVEEIPYLQVRETEEEEEIPQTESINDIFKGYLAEEYDGQMSLLLTEEATEREEQIPGQLTIEDVMAEWEKTKRAAEAALNDAREIELKSTKAKALKEANQVLSRLEGAMPMLDAGISSTELLKQEYLKAEETGEEEITEPVMPSESGFAIPKVDASGATTGSMEIPVITPSEGMQIFGAEEREPAISKSGVSLDTTTWTPPTLTAIVDDEFIDMLEASEMLADVNKMLQDEIDRLTFEMEAEEAGAKIALAPEETVQAEEPEEPEAEEATLSDEPEEEVLMKKEPQIPEIMEEPEEIPEVQILETTKEPEAYDSDIEFELDEVESKAEELPKEELPIESEEEIGEIILPEITLEGVIEDIPSEPEIPSVQILEPEDVLGVNKIDLQDVPDVAPTPKKEEPVKRSEVKQNYATDSRSRIKLDEEDVEIFSYFMSISGMRENISKILTSVAMQMTAGRPGGGGNIVIQGEKGTGKTQMATCLIKVLQKKIGIPAGGVGRIDAQKLNQKDLHDLFAKIQGGCLIIEDAGEITRDTALTLSLLLETDMKNTLIIIEDDKKGIEAALLKDASFTRRFTEKMVIPIFSIDELVDFGKTYATEAGYTIDEMGVLAMYNRINLIGKYDHATTVQEVAEIMDEAIENSKKVGFFGKKNKGNVLREKDFEK